MQAQLTPLDELFTDPEKMSMLDVFIALRCMAEIPEVCNTETIDRFLSWQGSILENNFASVPKGAALFSATGMVQAMMNDD